MTNEEAARKIGYALDLLDEVYSAKRADDGLIWLAVDEVGRAIDILEYSYSAIADAKEEAK